MKITNLFGTRKNYVLRPKNGMQWYVATLEVYHDQKLVNTIDVYKFWSVSDDGQRFLIHDVIGGSGIGFSPGKVMRSVYIGDGDYQELYHKDEKPKFLRR